MGTRLREAVALGLLLGVIAGISAAMPTMPRPSCPWSRSHISLRC